MEEKLTITAEPMPGHLLLKVGGRIDGYWSKPLDEHLDGLLKQGQYQVALDLTGVSYLSSLGIRILVRYRKLFAEVRGGFGIAAVSENVAAVLDMAGLTGMLQWQEVPATAPSQIRTETAEAHGFAFTLTRTGAAGGMTAAFHGDPDKLQAGYTASDCRTLPFGGKRYGLGLGAIGAGFEDCRDRFGEFVAFGDAVVYAPAGRTGSPDYQLRSGGLIPAVESLYGILLEGTFDAVVSFTPLEAGSSISIHNILEQLFALYGEERLVVVLAGETAGLVGASIDRSPASGDQAGADPFGFPAVRDTVRFTTEPEYEGMMVLAVGITDKGTEGPGREFLRPSAPGSAIRRHVHAAVFPYEPLRMNDPDPAGTVARLFGQDRVYGVLHLLNDAREGVGTGDSEFRSGVCWVAAAGSQPKTSRP